MSKIVRATQTIFGGTGVTSDFGEFGSLAAGTPTTTKNPATIQSLPAWLAGWAAATIGTLIPAYQDMNAVHYLAFYQICYLLQMGIAEYDTGTTYYTNSIVQYNGVLYQSLIDTNLNNEPDTSPSDWQCISSSIYGGTVASASSMMLPNIGSSFKITGSTTINNISSFPAGTIIDLVFESPLLVNIGGNILLNNGAFHAITNSSLLLISDGTNYFEISRSPCVQIGPMVSGLSGNTPYQASTSIMAYGTGIGGSGTTIGIQAGAVNGIWTQQLSATINDPANGSQQPFVCMLIPKGWWWQVVGEDSGAVSTVSYSPFGI
jgi:hypothetical protein